MVSTDVRKNIELQGAARASDEQLLWNAPGMAPVSFFTTSEMRNRGMTCKA
jgi:hypothetical protein